MKFKNEAESMLWALVYAARDGFLELWERAA